MSAAMRRAAVLLGILAALFALGCQKKTEPPAATDSGANGGAANVAMPDTAVSVMTFRWDATGNCMGYSPATVTVKVGNDMNFNNSASQTVTITAPAGCFSAAETTFTVVRGPSPALRAYSPGNYTLTTNPTTCSPREGGGPVILVDSGTEGGK